MPGHMKRRYGVVEVTPERHVVKMQGWSRRAEAWLSQLRTWQFVLIWDGAAVAGCMLGLLLGEWIGGHPFNPSALAGTAAGSLLAATVFAFAARSRMQNRAKHAPSSDRA
jgi:hypothetical protein